MLPGYFEKQMDLLNKYPQAGLCSGLSLKMNENGTVTGSIPTAVISSKGTYPSPAKVRQHLDRYGSWINGNTTIYRRACMDEFGGFRKELLSYTDGFLELIIALKIRGMLRAGTLKYLAGDAYRNQSGDRCQY